MEITYNRGKNRPAAFQLKLLETGCCPRLLTAHLCSAEDRLVVCYDTEGLYHPSTDLRMESYEKDVCRWPAAQFPDVLCWLRRVVEAVEELEEYLVGERDVSYCLEDLYLKGKGGPALMRLEVQECSLFEGLLSLCEQIYRLKPETLADHAARRLREQQAQQRMSRRYLLRLLSAWECEWRQAAHGAGEG